MTRFGHLATGSWPAGNAPWASHALRAQFPKLAFALGAAAFEVVVGAYLTRRPDADATELPEFLAQATSFPAWCVELAALDRARADVGHLLPARALTRRDLTIDRPLWLVPNIQLELTTTADELWSAIEHEEPMPIPCTLARPRTVVVWRAPEIGIRERVVQPDEAATLQSAQRGTSIAALATRFHCENPHARAVDVVLGWVDDRLLC
jgi:hypothetical protein